MAPAARSPWHRRWFGRWRRRHGRRLGSDSLGRSRRRNRGRDLEARQVLENAIEIADLHRMPLHHGRHASGELIDVRRSDTTQLLPDRRSTQLEEIFADEDQIVAGVKTFPEDGVPVLCPRVPAMDQRDPMRTNERRRAKSPNYNTSAYLPASAG